MQRLQKITTLLLIIFLSSCGLPEIEDLEQCSPEFHFIEQGTLRYLDEEISTCRCRMYRRKPEFFGPVGDFYKKDITYCQKIIGESPDNYLKVFNFFEEIRIKYNGIKGKKK